MERPIQGIFLFVNEKLLWQGLACEQERRKGIGIAAGVVAGNQISNLSFADGNLLCENIRPCAEMPCNIDNFVFRAVGKNMDFIRVIFGEQRFKAADDCLRTDGLQQGAEGRLEKTIDAVFDHIEFFAIGFLNIDNFRDISAAGAGEEPTAFQNQLSGKRIFFPKGENFLTQCRKIQRGLPFGIVDHADTAAAVDILQRCAEVVLQPNCQRKDVFVITAELGGV